MSKEFVAVVTDHMQQAGRLVCGTPLIRRQVADIMEAAIANPDFQRQVRAYAAEVARGCVPDEYKPAGRSGHDYVTTASRNACRAETLAAIDRWEKGK